MTRLTALWHVTEVLAKTYIQHKRKTKQNKKGKKAKLETTNETIRHSSKNKKNTAKTYLNLFMINISNNLWEDL